MTNQNSPKNLKAAAFLSLMTILIYVALKIPLDWDRYHTEFFHNGRKVGVLACCGSTPVQSGSVFSIKPLF